MASLVGAGYYFSHKGALPAKRLANEAPLGSTYQQTAPANTAPSYESLVPMPDADKMTEMTQVSLERVFISMQLGDRLEVTSMGLIDWCD